MIFCSKTSKILRFHKWPQNPSTSSYQGEMSILSFSEVFERNKDLVTKICCFKLSWNFIYKLLIRHSKAFTMIFYYYQFLPKWVRIPIYIYIYIGICVSKNSKYIYINYTQILFKYMHHGNITNLGRNL